jgi:hypothetical protein
MTPEPAQAFAAGGMEPSTAEEEREKTPDLTITGEILLLFQHKQQWVRSRKLTYMGGWIA